MYPAVGLTECQASRGAVELHCLLGACVKEEIGKPVDEKIILRNEALVGHKSKIRYPGASFRSLRCLQNGSRITQPAFEEWYLHDSRVSYQHIWLVFQAADQQAWPLPCSSSISKEKYASGRLALYAFSETDTASRHSLLVITEGISPCLRLKNFLYCSVRPKKKALPYHHASQTKV